MSDVVSLIRSYVNEVTRAKMTIDDAINEWTLKKRSMGCVSASKWFCSKVVGFHPLRLTRYTKNGDEFEHVVATNGRVIIDLSPYADVPTDHDPDRDG